MRSAPARHALRTLLLGAATVLSIGAASGLAAAPAWSPAASIGPMQALTSLSFDASLGLDASGNAVAVWSGASGVLAASQTAGGRWSAAVDVSRLGPDEANDLPQVAVLPGNRALAIWPSQNTNRRLPPAYALKTSIRAANGSWSAPLVVVSSGKTTYFAPRLGTDRLGNALAIWQACTSATGRCVIQAATLRRGAGAWSAPVDLSSPTGSANPPSLAVNPYGIALGAWEERNASGATVVRAALRQVSGTWTAAVDLSAPGAAGEQVAIDALGRAVVVWGDATAIRARARDAHGTWSAATALSRGSLTSPASLAMDFPGNALVAWDESDASTGDQYVLVATRSPGGSWSAPVQVSRADAFTLDNAPSAPQVAVSPAGALQVVSWVDNSTNNARVATRRATATWNAPVPLGSALYGTSVLVAANAGPRARALWGMPFFSPRGGEGWAPAASSYGP